MKTGSRKGRNTVLTIVAVLIIALCVGAGIWFMFRMRDQIKADYETQISDLNLKIMSKTRTVYVAKDYIRSGQMISRDMFDLKEVLTDAADYLSEEDFGKTMLVNVDAGTEMKKAFVSGEVVDAELREVEYNCIEVSSNVNTADYVDVRILLPDGSDYIIMSKKQVKALNETKLVCDLWVTEEELLLMDSAMVDAYLYRSIDERVLDAKIYVTKYILPTVQDASEPNYTPSEVTAELIQNNPNIVNVASKYLASELRQKKQLELNDFLPHTNDGLTWYDSTGRYLGRATEAEVMGNDIVNSSGSIPGSELPSEYGDTLWGDYENKN